ncbi:ferredoxin reductase family protein [Iodobacter fluviatilis]|uniref:Dihydroorotate dehydrogenase electron transfer subunit n=1 Tax=Iodobacter fluviatilis TaxID=537 RepID=A0A377Q539_9NEIS|nr:ferric reductase-like transmembrane domain-containing protein [Iodobacter fluviatilis]TCU84106.1 putative ferric reductase [Iodobacter fluviatilis]STQ89719.1 dihydroorotate dehydrogenase electron transfer subunit [Iodobacter fluviatilis]
MKPLPILLLISTLLYSLCSYLQNGIPASYWDWRHELVLLSGVQLMTVMSAAMLLATRPAWLEKPLSGLDKMYGLHKQLGIAAGILLASHWLVKLSPKLVMAMEWAAPRIKRSGGIKDPLVSFAKDVGEWAAWAVLAMVILALLRAVPYRFWRKVHKLFAPLFLMGAFHGLILMPRSMWLTPVGALMAALLMSGSICAIYSLLGKIGKSRKVNGHISQITPLPAQQLEVICQMDSHWPGHQAGQFALVSFNPSEGAHPYTIASAPRKNGELRFIIKALGDYTRTLPQDLKVGGKVIIEGPYGCFNGASHGPHQAWIAGGIGITPFLAWLESPAFKGQQIDFYYCVKSAKDAARLEEIQAACLAKKLRLHLIESDAGQRLNIAEIKAETLDDIWYCGPQSLGKAIGEHLAQMSKPPRFHHEAFAMR